VATILTPADGSFYVAGNQVNLTGTATDAQDPYSSLTFRWEMDIHHNNHVHPNSVVLTGPVASYMADNHDDGTGVFDEIRLIVTDTGNKKDTTRVNIYPEIDLQPSAVVTVPSTPGTTAPAEYSFWIHNRGRMPAPNSRWRLIAGNTLLAQSDVIVPALDSVFVGQIVPPTLAAGTYTLRVKVDSLGAVVETNEANNAVARPLTVVPGNGPDEVPPTFASGPFSVPHDNSADIVWQTSEPTTGVVRYGTALTFSDSLASPLQTQHDDLLTGLDPATRYFYQVVATDTAFNTAIAPIDSFLTSGTVAVLDAPLVLRSLELVPEPEPRTVLDPASLPHGARVGFSVLDIQGRRSGPTRCAICRLAAGSSTGRGAERAAHRSPPASISPESASTDEPSSGGSRSSAEVFRRSPRRCSTATLAGGCWHLDRSSGVSTAHPARFLALDSAAMNPLSLLPSAQATGIRRKSVASADLHDGYLLRLPASRSPLQLATAWLRLGALQRRRQPPLCLAHHSAARLRWPPPPSTPISFRRSL
jgi:hypothetical protein